MKRILLIAASVVIGVVVLAGLWLWLFFDANQLRPRLESAMGGAVGRKVVLGTIRLAPFSGSIAVDDVAIGDDARFGAAPFVTAKSVSVGVELWPLIASRDLRVESFRLVQPHIRLLRTMTGEWNFSSLGGAASAPSAGGTAAASGAIVRKITVDGGQILVGTAGDRGKERVYDDVNVEIRDLSLTSRFPFQADAKTPGGGTLQLKGEVGPVNARDAAATPFDATAELRRLDIASTGFVDPSSGVAGTIDYAGALHSDGHIVTSKGKVNAARMQLVRGGSPARVPFEIDYQAEFKPEAQSGTVKQGDVHVGKATARLTGTYSTAGQTPTLRMKLSGDRMAVTELQSALPALGIALPSGASMHEGTVDTDLVIDGPADRLVIAGPVKLSNAVMNGFDLGSKLGAISSLSGLPQTGETTIDVLSCTLRVAPSGIEIDNLMLIAPSIGTLAGKGTISPTGNLAFVMLAKPASTRGAAGSVARVASLGQPANGIPFRIEGTTASPVFVPDVSRAVTNVLKSDETRKKATDVLGGLFRKKK